MVQCYPDFSHERAAMADGFAPVAGVDEAGRGPLAGPVVAAAVILDPANIPDGLNDSKKLSPHNRAALYDDIMASALVGIGQGSLERIARDNILQATLWAMARAAAALDTVPGLVLVDGNRCPELDMPVRAIIGGDAVSQSIAAASIIAKVRRDNLMAVLDEKYPGYGFARHKGYGTRAHLEALAALGPCPAHRRTFGPVRALLERRQGR